MSSSVGVWESVQGTVPQACVAAVLIGLQCSCFSVLEGPAGADEWTDEATARGHLLGLSMSVRSHVEAEPGGPEETVGRGSRRKLALGCHGEGNLREKQESI